MNIRRLVLTAFTAIPGLTMAQEVTPPVIERSVLNPHFEDTYRISPAEPQAQRTEVRDSVSRGQLTQASASKTTKADELGVMEQAITLAIVIKDWPQLKVLTAHYEKLAFHDPILVHYAKGAYYRSAGQHQQAIREYRQIIALRPELTYVRLDLAAMLFENKEYEAAADQFRKVQAADLQPAARQMVEKYLEAIQKRNAWSFDIDINYTYDNNVNNASEIREIQIGPATFIKNEDSLPKSAKGLSYSFGASKDFNITGNHYLSTQASLYGVHYWDQKDYSERTIRLSAGYKYQDINSWFTARPFVERTWLGSPTYSRNKGFSTEYGRWINPRWQGVASYTYMRKNYEDKQLNFYEGKLHAFSLTTAHFLSPSFIVFGGASMYIDRLNDRSESSVRLGPHIGFVKEWQGGLSTRVNLQYVKRKFDDKHWLFGEKRIDNELNTNFTIWHRNLHFYGVTPKIHFRHQRINSNLAALYSRRSNQIFFSLEKEF